MSEPQAILLLLGAEDPASLSRELERSWEAATRASSLADLETSKQPASGAALRAAVVGPDPEELAQRLEVCEGWLSEGAPGPLRVQRGIVLGAPKADPRIGFLFPGQGAPVPTEAGYLAEWLPEAAAAFELAPELAGTEEVPDELVQLSAVTASLAGLRAMDELGIEAAFSVGHSVGELTALHWAGALDEESLLRIARRRGEAMTAHASGEGAMASIEADEETFREVIEGAGVTVAAVNSPRHRVVSGAVEAVDAVVDRARETDGTRAVHLRVVGAFHSPLIEAAVPVFERDLREEDFAPLSRRVHSTVTGGPLDPDADLRALLIRQMTNPVRFLEAASVAAADADLLIEVGPGRMLSGLVAEFDDTPTIPLRIGHPSPQGLLTAVAAAFALGIPVNVDRLQA